MTSESAPFVFDTGPLRHFALQGWLGVLKFLTAERGLWIPESVEAELKEQAHENPALELVLAADWIRVDRSDDLEFIVAFAGYEERLAVGRKNRGECGVLALAKTKGYLPVLDDNVPRSLAEEEHIPVTATLPLLCDAIRSEQLTLRMVESLADDLLGGEYFLPFKPGGFRIWAMTEGGLEYR